MSELTINDIYSKSYKEILQQLVKVDVNLLTKSNMQKTIVYLLGGRCDKCGTVHFIDIHHIKPLKEGGSNELSNIELLCCTCHRNEHQKVQVKQTICPICGKLGKRYYLHSKQTKFIGVIYNHYNPDLKYSTIHPVDKIPFINYEQLKSIRNSEREKEFKKYLTN